MKLRTLLFFLLIALGGGLSAQTAWTNLTGTTSTSSPASTTAHGQSGGKTFTFRNSDWTRGDTCAYWGLGDTMQDVINGYNTLPPGNACSNMSDLIYSAGSSNQDSGTWVYTGTTQFYYRTTGGTFLLNTNIATRLTVQITDTLFNKIGTQSVNNVNLHRITDNFRVHVLIECMSPAGAAYFSPGAAGFWTPAIDLFNYLYTSSSSSIC
ncbi:MAG: hypothetical protein LPK45_01020, partial [Bacteroidota bacterium]|nr:hypothetical protein [Bacteroidota bacterium]MDX5429609.1 hypothetical protein [Bacteroidota bacterium]MDX5468393.1 hypothetical protein [Bacteroidota bacterium]